MVLVIDLIARGLSFASVAVNSRSTKCDLECN